MFLGHYAVALGAKRIRPRVSLGTMVMAAQFADLLWPLLLLLGIERIRIHPEAAAFTTIEFTHYPITHSLLGITVLGILLGLVFFGARRYAAGAWIVGLLVVSHWFLDLIVHVPDLPLAPGSGTRVGLGLWHSVAGTMVVELGLFAVGVYLYWRGTTARDGIGRYGFWTLAAVLLVVYLASSFGPPPPDIRTIAVAGLVGGWLTVAWAYWVDAHRQPAATH